MIYIIDMYPIYIRDESDLFVLTDDPIC